ncbi:MAG: flagellar hook-associated protein FlgK [SAR324 cluster bacterium]|uniref:Flagellar hook-associated protein 1 n=1 Tax=SAR324 cluster bacterium TaxID=2024889 RepID=A0A2A4T896_9DELT|nr:MAG: flagellar hook-associated protein FlgK [SAR324 cluster bacterium]
MSLFGSFDIGKKALSAAQLGQSVVGHNVANVGTEGFSRQEVLQAAGTPNDGKVHGVDVLGVRRIHDRFTKAKVVDEQNVVSSWETRKDVLIEAEVIYSDMEGKRLRGDLDAFWNAWSSVANEPESVTMRKALLAKSESLVNGFKGFHERLGDFRERINERLNQEFEEVNQITRSIADLNTQVQQLESRGLAANDARDQREQLLQDLSSKITVQSFENPRGTLEIQVANGQYLVQGREYFALKPIMDSDDAVNIHVGLVDDIGAITDISGLLKGGKIKEYIEQRDGNINRYREEMNSLIKEVAFQVNRVHSQGTGLKSARYTETGPYLFGSDERTRPLPFLQTGSFEIKLVDQDNTIKDVINVQVVAGEDTIESIVEKINRAAEAYEVIDEEGNESIKEHTKFKATIAEDGRITFRSGLGNQFIYGEDDSGAMALLGFNSFFHIQEGASDIRLNAELVENEMRITTGSDLTPGDNQLALQISELQRKATMEDESISFDQFFNNQITDIGLKVQDASKGLRGHNQMLEQYEALRDSVSSVNLDEEMANMIKYQRAYESSAKFMSTIDQMTQTIINM